MIHRKLDFRRKARRKITSEDFTPHELVNEMLNKLPVECFTDPTKTFCDPAAGNGNFLVEVLRRKLDLGHDPIQAISTIYGIELMNDNVEQMKNRLLALVPDYNTAKRIIDKNIVCHNSLTWDFVNWTSL
jgi:hypothetical protein